MSWAKLNIPNTSPKSLICNTRAQRQPSGMCSFCKYGSYCSFLAITGRASSELSIWGRQWGEAEGALNHIWMQWCVTRNYMCHLLAGCGQQKPRSVSVWALHHSDLLRGFPGSEEILNNKGTRQNLTLEGGSLRNLDEAIILQLQRRGLLF